MNLGDFMSRMGGSKGDVWEVIPVSFNSHSILTEDYENLSNLHSETYGVVTRFIPKQLRFKCQRCMEQIKQWIQTEAWDLI